MFFIFKRICFFGIHICLFNCMHSSIILFFETNFIIFDHFAYDSTRSPSTWFVATCFKPSMFASFVFFNIGSVLSAATRLGFFSLRHCMQKTLSGSGNAFFVANEHIDAQHVILLHAHQSMLWCACCYSYRVVWYFKKRKRVNWTLRQFVGTIAYCLSNLSSDLNVSEKMSCTIFMLRNEHDYWRENMIWIEKPPTSILNKSMLI